MKTARKHIIRFAQQADQAAIESLNPYCQGDALLRKIKASEVVVIENGAAEIVGLIRFEFLWTTQPFLSLIYIRPDSQGQGLSRRALRFLVEHLKQRGDTRLLSSTTSNEPAPQAWHRHMGFLQAGKLTEIEPGVAELFYWLDL
jgi:ribosomal protein S18 acetylase RimI-like enzyme